MHKLGQARLMRDIVRRIDLLAFIDLIGKAESCRETYANEQYHFQPNEYVRKQLLLL